MKSTVSRFSSAEIARLEEARQARMTAALSDAHEPVGGGIMCYAGPGAWANQACGLGLQGAVAADEVDRLVDFYVSRATEPRIEVCALAHPSLLSALADRNFVLINFEEVLARPLDPDEDLLARFPYEWPEGLRVGPIYPETADETRFLEVVGEGFCPPDDVVAASMTRLAQRQVSLPDFTSWLAWFDGVAVGGASLEIASPLACLMGASTRPEFRRRGVQTALLVTRMEHAQTVGCRLAVVHGDPGEGTSRNARRLGFRLAYTKATLVMRGAGLMPSP